MKKFAFPATKPQDSPDAVAEFQARVLSYAEQLLGPRPSGWTVCPPLFYPAHPFLFPFQPCLYADETLKTVQPGLTHHSGENWRDLMQVLSHETVHMLDPCLQSASFLEEGIAELFAHDVMAHHGETMPPARAPYEVYNDARALVQQSFPQPFDAARQLREDCGGFNRIDAPLILKRFPGISAETADALLQKLKPVYLDAAEADVRYDEALGQPDRLGSLSRFFCIKSVRRRKLKPGKK